MDKHIIKLLIINILIVNTSFSQPVKEGSHIIGSVNGIDSSFLLLIDPKNDSIVANVPILDGKFELYHELQYANKFILRIMPINIGFRAIIEPGYGFIKVDTSKTQWFGDRSNPKNSWGLIWEIEQGGTPIAEDWNKMMQETDNYDFTKKSQFLYKKLDEFKGNKDIADSIQRSIDKLSITQINKIKKWMETFIELNPGSLSSPYLLLEIYSIDRNPKLSYYAALIDKIIEPAKNTLFFNTLLVTRKKMERSLEGQEILSFSLRQNNGKDFLISNFKGKYIIIDFWASWCAPCRASIPGLKEIYNKCKKNGLEIVGVSTDKDINAWHRALTKEKMPWVQLIDAPIEIIDNETLSDFYSIKAIPFYLVINPEGIIINTSDDAKDLITYINSIVNPKTVK